MRTLLLGCVLALASDVVWAAPTVPFRQVRLVQEASELGLTAGITPEADGSVIVIADAGSLSVRKRVYSDGRFTLRLSRGAKDRLTIVGELDGIAVTFGEAPAIDLRSGTADYEGAAHRVRVGLAMSKAVQQLQQVVAALERQDVESPEALSLRITGALIAELLGDVRAAERFGQSVAKKSQKKLRPAQSGGTGYGMTCYDIWQRIVVQASYQLESCLAGFSVINPLRNICSLVWTLQVESAWFQFLSCSAFPLKVQLRVQ